jgi:DNA-directed RNA polymerase specialized sigma24 family protein
MESVSTDDLRDSGSTPLDDCGPWLARVATNLGIDALRRRKRRSYTGPWLPSPVETPASDIAPSSDSSSIVSPARTCAASRRSSPNRYTR